MTMTATATAAAATREARSRTCDRWRRAASTGKRGRAPRGRDMIQVGRCAGEPAASCHSATHCFQSCCWHCWHCGRGQREQAQQGRGPGWHWHWQEVEREISAPGGPGRVRIQDARSAVRCYYCRRVCYYSGCRLCVLSPAPIAILARISEVESLLASMLPCPPTPAQRTHSAARRTAHASALARRHQQQQQEDANEDEEWWSGEG